MISSCSSAREVAEVVAVAGHADDQVAVLLGVGLGLAQRLGVDHVELDVVAVHLEVAADQVRQLVDARPRRPAATGVNFMFSSVPPVLTWSILRGRLEARRSGRGGRRPARARCPRTAAGRRGGRRAWRRSPSRSRRGRWSAASRRGSAPPVRVGPAVDRVEEGVEDAAHEVVGAVVVVAVLRRPVDAAAGAGAPRPAKSRVERARPGRPGRGACSSKTTLLDRGEAVGDAADARRTGCRCCCSGRRRRCSRGPCGCSRR